ncbi:SPOR domain-containing protein [Cellulomonas fimi]|uniref:SPOR domain-containing protein n=1 Tax=Cellulomonas fimi TaxID=1708 RepID=A0A7Y0M137_CELFI|nr:SPOR domain-containing protein [Cellulomonas fimi]NMR21499.1 SPOR domain-containing protein [Cellulomonas fimi]
MAGTGGTEQYWYNIVTKTVETGHQSTWQDRMGPYATREEAEQALLKARARTEAWDDEDERYQR